MNLRDYRISSGLTQESLAEKSNISIRTIQRIEKGQTLGSTYTLKKLSEALNLEDWKSLLESEPIIKHMADLKLVKLMNLSSLAVLIVPFGNFIFPLIFFFNKNKKMNSEGRKILSFQLLWMLTTLVLMLILPLILFWFFDSLKGARIPLYVLVYSISVVANLLFILRIAIRLNSEKDILKFVPQVF